MVTHNSTIVVTVRAQWNKPSKLAQRPGKALHLLENGMSVINLEVVSSVKESADFAALGNNTRAMSNL